MSEADNVELSQLSIKDLRLLAGEHHITNRSRLGRSALINELQQVLAAVANRQTGAVPEQQQIAAVANAVAAESSAPAPVVTETVTPVIAEVATAPAPVVISPVVAAPIAAAPVAVPVPVEPEVLDAAAVAGLVAEPERAVSAVASAVTQNEIPSDATPEGSDVSGEGEPRRRRRRRRRGGRNRDRANDGQPGAPGADAQGDDSDDGDDADESADAAPVATSPVPGALAVQTNRPIAPVVAPSAAPVTAPPAVQSNGPRPVQPNAGQSGNGEVRNGQSSNGQSNHGQPGSSQGQGQPRPAGDQRPPRPRIDGPQRHMPSVLDRLCTFTRGILELCDPSTPSWAQARLSELLAEAGLVPIPAQGQPHPDYHTVVGTVAAKDQPAGIITAVEAPGFALRGDRGDLFPLRKASVRVSGEQDSWTAPAQAVVAAPVAPIAPRVSVPAAQSAPQVPRPQADRPAFVAPVAPVAPRPPVAPIHNQDPELITVEADSIASMPEPRQARPRDEQRPRQDAPRPPRDESQPREERQPAPEQGRDPHQKHTREYPSESPKLPLASQDPAELAARPKAEGFRCLGLNDQILADLAAVGWQEPSPIQLQAIPIALTGRDLIGQAQTGTGKTGAFALPILQKLYALEDQDRRPVTLVLCPTRELAKQVYSEFTKMAGASGARATVIYGGTPMDEQFRALDRHPHIVIGTPGRIIDHMKRRTLDLSRLAAVVLDEADQMLDIGFWPDVQYIIGHTPPTRQILLFSATFPDPIRQMAEKHMKSPEHVRITPKVVTVDQVDQKFIAIARERKNDLLAHFIDTQKPDSMIVFCRTRHQTDRVAEVLKRKNISAGAIHGDLPQTKREKILAQFRSGELKCLIATNVAARGLDIPIVSHVVNYDIPEMPEEYVHRIGRTARNGAPGVARTFITNEDGQFLLEIEKHIGLLLEEERIEGFTVEAKPMEQVRSIAAEPAAGTPRLLKPLAGGIRLGRRRR